MNQYQHIFSSCVYDVDNRYVDMYIRPVYKSSFMLTVSNTENTGSEIELYLTKEDLKLVIDRLTAVLENER